VGKFLENSICDKGQSLSGFEYISTVEVSNIAASVGFDLGKWGKVWNFREEVS
jgi:hypothetical protein